VVGKLRRLGPHRSYAVRYWVRLGYYGGFRHWGYHPRLSNRKRRLLDLAEKRQQKKRYQDPSRR